MIWGGQKVSKRVQKGSPKGAKIDTKWYLKTNNLGNLFCTNFDHDLERFEEPKLIQIEMTEGVRGQSERKMHVDENAGKTIEKPTFFPKRKGAFATKDALTYRKFQHRNIAKNQTPK